MRATRKAVYSAFTQFIKALNAREAASFRDEGGYTLSYNQYGGYAVELISSNTGSISQPFGFELRTGREMLDTLKFATRALELKK